MSAADPQFTETSQLWPCVPQMRISMLGATGSGKSSYLAVMYDSIVREDYLYTFKADNGVRLRVNGEINALRDGKPLEPTDEASPKEHHYTLGSLRDGKFTTLVDVELTDFRGGAILFLGAANTDSARLYGQLPESHSIFVVLDSAHFVEPVTPAEYERIAGATDANHIANLIGGVLVDRQQANQTLPSVAVLLSKSDVLYESHQHEQRPRRDPDDVRQDVRGLLPAAFGLGSKSGFFQVSIGSFATEDGTNRLTAVRPDGVAAPVFFAVACFLTDHHLVLRDERDMIEAQRKKALARRDSLQSWPPFIQRWFLQRKIDDVKAALDRMEKQLRAYHERSADLTAELKLLWEWLRPELWSHLQRPGHQWSMAGPLRPTRGGRRCRKAPTTPDGSSR